MNYFKVYCKNKLKRIAVCIKRTGMIVDEYIETGI